MDDELKKNLYKLLELLGRMEVTYTSGLVKVYFWNFEENKPQIVK